MTSGDNVDHHKVLRAVDEIFRFQDSGVDAVKEEQKGYVAPPAERPLWADLVELAISLGTQGLATLANRVLRARLANSLGIGGKALAGSAPGPAVSKHPGPYAVLKEGEPLDLTPNPDVEADPSSKVGTIIGGLITGIEHSGTAAIKAAGVQGPPDASPEAQASMGISQNPAIDFFTEQKNGVAAAKTRASNASAEAYARLIQLDQLHPGIAMRIADMMSLATDQLSRDAQQEQMKHTTAQW